MAIKIKGSTVIYDDEVFRVSANTEANRPAQPIQGMLRFNTDAGTFEGYDGTDWGPIGGSGNGSPTPFKSYVANFGNGSTNPVEITHNLSTTNLLFAVRNNSTGYYVYPDVKIINSNKVQLEFVTTPTTNQYLFLSIGY